MGIGWTSVIAALEGADLWIVLIIVVVLFGGSQLPKLARSIGSASHEFRKGIEEGSKGEETGAQSSDPSAEKAKKEEG
jgi:sec-independent protein translocase protein TatA